MTTALQSAPVCADSFRAGIPSVAEIMAAHPILKHLAEYDAALAAPTEFSAGELSQTSLEMRADVDALPRLHHRRRQIVADLARLAALFEGGQAPLADARRKQHRALVSQRILAECEGRGEKAPSETALERMANADPEHVAFCNWMEGERTRYVLLRNARDEVEEEIRSREIQLYSYNAEARLK